MVLERIGEDLINNGVQVMMPWEKEYMEFCIEKLNPRGKVLEIGFGLGYSATAICSRKDVEEYSVIECAPLIWDEVEKFKTKFPNIKINLIKGRWEDVMYLAGKFDFAFFDPLNGDGTVQWAKFVMDCIRYNMKVGSVIGMYSTTDIISNLPFTKETYHQFDVTIPPECKYAKGDKMFVKIFEVTEPWRKLPPPPRPEPRFGKLLSSISFSAHLETNNKNIFKIYKNVCEDDMKVLAPVDPIKCELTNDFKVSEKIHLWFKEKCTIKIFGKYQLDIEPDVFMTMLPGDFELVSPEKIFVKIFLVK